MCTTPTKMIIFRVLLRETSQKVKPEVISSENFKCYFQTMTFLEKL